MKPTDSALCSDPVALLELAREILLSNVLETKTTQSLDLGLFLRADLGRCKQEHELASHIIATPEQVTGTYHDF